MGEWRISEVGYLEPYHVVCELCGQLVPGRYWLERVAGSDRIFCDAGHAERYQTYWLPRYAAAGGEQ
jgi:hypothetical protein